MIRVKIILTLIITVFFLSACAHKPDINVSNTLGKSEVQLQKPDKVKTTASAFDGKDVIKFRLMVEGSPSKDEAEKLFNETLNTIATNSNHEDFWNYYNAQFDIKSYDKGILYEATKSKRSNQLIIRN